MIFRNRSQEKQLLNSEAQLLHSDEKNLKESFSCAASDRNLQNEQTVRSAIEQSVIVRQSNVSTAEEVYIRKSSKSILECEVLHIQKVEFADDKSLLPSKAPDLELKLSMMEKMLVNMILERKQLRHTCSSYSKQDNELEQSSDFAVTKAIGTDRNQLSMGLTDREEIVQNKREV